MEWLDVLVGEARERMPRRMTGRERAVVAGSAAAFACAAVAILLYLPSGRELDLPLLALLVVAFAITSRVEFEIGSGFAVPDALALVPIFLLVPLDLVPLVVASGFLLSRAWDFASGRVHPERALYCVHDAWLSIGPVLVLAALSSGRADVDELPVYALAFAAQLASALLAATAAEWGGLGTRPADTARSVLFSYRIEAVLWPIGLMAAVAAVELPLILLGIGPLVWLLTVFSRERRERYAAALELNRAYRGTVMLLAEVVDSDDTYTGEHCRSVVELASLVGAELGVERMDRQELEFAALLHDVGKIAIPKEILNKPDKLTDEEFELMKTHTIAGELFLNRVGGLLGRVGRIVRSCHERWDGRGYPDGLAGERIPLAARVVFACDAYNAMTTDRPYRAAMSHDVAQTELLRNSGSQFDPRVVTALLHVVHGGGLAQGQEAQGHVAEGHVVQGQVARRTV